MVLQNILLGQVVRILSVVTEKNRHMPLYAMTKAVQERYNFLQKPNIVQDYNWDTGITFASGLYNDVIIDRLQLFSQGIVCEARADTRLVDNFADDLMMWGSETFHWDFSTNHPFSKLYGSQLEVGSHADFSGYFKQFTRLGEAIQKSLASYGQERPQYAVSSLRFHMDVIGATPPTPVEFVFERRGSQPWGTTYFSAAPLTTADHLQCLSLLEGLLLEG